MSARMHIAWITLVISVAACAPNTPYAYRPASPSPTLTVSPAPIQSPVATASAAPSPENPTPALVPSLTCPGQYQQGHPLVIASPLVLGRYPSLAVLDVFDPLAPSSVCTVNISSFPEQPIQWLSGSEFLLIQNRPNRLIDVDVARRSITPFRELNGSVFLASLSPDRAWLATMELNADGSKVARLYGPSGERTLATFPQVPGPAGIEVYGLGGPKVEFSPDGALVLAVDWQASIADPRVPNLQLFNLQGSRISWDSKGVWAAWVRASLYYTTGDGKVHKWVDGAFPITVLESAWLQPAVSPDGQNIAYLSTPGYRYNLEVMETKSGKAKALNTTGQRIHALFVTPSLLWAGDVRVCDSCQGGFQQTGKVYAYDLSTGVEREVRLPDLLYLGGASRSSGA